MRNVLLIIGVLLVCSMAATTAASEEEGLFAGLSPDFDSFAMNTPTETIVAAIR